LKEGAFITLKKLFDETFHKGDIVRVESDLMATDFEVKYIVVSVENYEENGVPKTKLILKQWFGKADADNEKQ